MNKIIVVSGPTASGKTALAVEIAKKYGGEVISADSMQIYTDMDVASAKATPEEQQGIPHHMMDFLDPAESFSVADWVRMAGKCANDILSRGKMPVICGGTGLYISSFVDNLQFDESECDYAFREEMRRFAEEHGAEALLEKLREVDPETAGELHANNMSRVIRALEVYLETGETISAHNAATRQLPPRYDAVWIGLQFADRADMKALIDRRVDKMAEEGLLEEVQALLAMGLPRNATAMQAIGYKEFLGVLDGTLTEQEALELVKLRSRQYAKRQLTWLRRNPAIHWIYWEKDRDFARALQISTEILTASGLG